jgi:Ca2+-binding EF-hand superfamily protein
VLSIQSPVAVTPFPFRDQNGRIDFNEFIIATHCTATSSPADKLHWVFQMYDKDNSNTIQLSEMVELFGTLYLSEGLEKEAAVERAIKIFSALDINNDGDITEEEFVRGCLQVTL